MVLPFLFLLWLILGTAGLEQAKNLAGESSPPDSNPFNDAESAENRASLSRQFAAAANSLIQVRETRSAFHPHAQRNAFRRRDERPQSRSFARENQSLRHNQAPTAFLDITGDDFSVLHVIRLCPVL